MPDSLEDLLRRRALLREHLEALDREIANLRGDEPPPFLGGTDEDLAENILEKYRQASSQDTKGARRGCLLYFAGAIALLFLGLAAMYFYVKSRHGP
ncbi:MAG TPA: hypothetical protein VII43_06800 [Opitutaceae bacterium]